MQRYPNYDVALAELLICPLTGKPILRARAAPGSDEYLRRQDILPAVERALDRTGKPTIWVVKDEALSDTAGESRFFFKSKK